jgi:hypothetical protein
MIRTGKQVSRYPDGTEIITGYLVEETINGETRRFLGDTRQKAIEMWFDSLLEQQEIEKRIKEQNEQNS